MIRANIRHLSFHLCLSEEIDCQNRQYYLAIKMDMKITRDTISIQN